MALRVAVVTGREFLLALAGLPWLFTLAVAQGVRSLLVSMEPKR